MKNIKKDIEQLEIAGELLDKNSHTGARLSLFLLDNLAELMMYNFVRNEFLRDDEFSGVLKLPKYSAKKRRKILDYFNDKVNFLSSELKQLNSHQCNILKLGHYLRNEAYHNGILRENIIILVTRTYFQTVCEILPAFWTGSLSFTDYSEVTDFLKKYVKTSEHIDLRKTLKEICQIILKGRECTASQLSKALSNDLVSRIEETIDGIKYAASENKQKSPEEVLKWMQFRDETDRISFKITEQTSTNLKSEGLPDDILKKLENMKNRIFIGEEKFIDVLKTMIGDKQTVWFKSLILKYSTDMKFGKLERDEDFNDFWENVNTAFSEFSPKITLKTLNAWKEKAKEIMFEISHGAACVKFHEIDKSFLKIENIFFEAIFQYEKHINSQIHS